MLINVYGQCDQFVAQNLLHLPTSHVLAEYVWIDLNGQNVHSKTRTLNYVPTSINDFSDWSFENISIDQTDGDANEEILLKPIAFFRDPFRLGEHKLVLCETFANNNQPHVNNRRRQCLTTMQLANDEKPWFSMKQEYIILDDVQHKFGLRGATFNNLSSHSYYCSVGVNKSLIRNIAEAHYRCCLYAGIKIISANSESMPGKYKFQIGVCEGIEMGDHLWMARYLLYRVAEAFGIDVTLNSMAVSEKLNEAKCYTNFSTEKMRNCGGEGEIGVAIEKLSKAHHDHILCYSLAKGRYSTCFIGDFSYDIGRRNVSVRIPRHTHLNRCGHFEDRRPPSNCDPYSVTEALVRTCCLTGNTTLLTTNNSQLELNHLANNASPNIRFEPINASVDPTIILTTTTTDECHLFKRKPNEPQSIQQRLMHGLLAPDTVEKIANAANQNLSTNYNLSSTNCCVNEPSSSNSLLTSIDNNLERYLDQNNIQDFLANFDFQNDDWFDESMKSCEGELLDVEANQDLHVEQNQQIEMQFQQPQRNKKRIEPDIIVIDKNENEPSDVTLKNNNVQNLILVLADCDENQSASASTISTSTTGLSVLESKELNLIESNSAINWKLIPLEHKRRPLDYYSRRDASLRVNVLRQVTNARHKKYSDESEEQKSEFRKRSGEISFTEKFPLPKDSWSSHLIEEIPHLSVMSRIRKNSNRSNQTLKTNNEREFYLVASSIDPIFYDQPSTSSCSLIKRALNSNNNDQMKMHEKWPDDDQEHNVALATYDLEQDYGVPLSSLDVAEEHNVALATGSSSIHTLNSNLDTSSSSRESNMFMPSRNVSPLISEHVAPEMLLSPLKPFYEYSGERPQELTDNNDNTTTINDDFDYEVSDGEIESDMNDNLHNELFNYESGEIMTPPSKMQNLKDHHQNHKYDHRITQTTKRRHSLHDNKENQSTNLKRSKYRERCRSPLSDRRYGRDHSGSFSSRRYADEDKENISRRHRHDYNNKMRDPELDVERSKNFRSKRYEKSRRI